MQQEPLAAHKVQQVLSDAATGRVRRARQLHMEAVLGHQRRIGWIAFFIAFVTNLIPGLWCVYLRKLMLQASSLALVVVILTN